MIAKKVLRKEKTSECPAQRETHLIKQLIKHRIHMAPPAAQPSKQRLASIKLRKAMEPTEGAASEMRASVGADVGAVGAGGAGVGVGAFMPVGFTSGSQLIVVHDSGACDALRLTVKYGSVRSGLAVTLA